MHRSVTTALIALALALVAPPAFAQDSDDALARSIAQLRSAVGRWHVVTEFLQPDGSVARSIPGSYTFEWVVEDRVVSGRSELPELQRTSAILFYVNEAEARIEMVSVGADGKLWIMIGPLGGETRYSQEYETGDGGKAQLRFTRYNVSPDSFESRMEYTTDGGASWHPGNHQVFVRAES